jgi:uncharacterized OB-fold protein
MGNEFDRAVAIVELEFSGFRFRRTANTLPNNVEFGDEVDLQAIRMGTIGTWWW